MCTLKFVGLMQKKSLVMQSLCTSRRKFCVKFVNFAQIGGGRGSKTQSIYPKMEKSILLKFGHFASKLTFSLFLELQNNVMYSCERPLDTEAAV